jgi:hypothetical protein
MTESTPPADMPPAPMAPEPAPMAPPPMAPMAPPPVALATGRPTGATVITILAVVNGVIFSLGALAALLFGTVAGGILGSSGVENAGAVGGVAAGIGIVVAIIVLLIALLFYGIAYGTWKGRGWAWMLGIVVSIVVLVFGVLGQANGISVVSLILYVAIPAVTIYFLWQPEVKRWLGRPV